MKLSILLLLISIKINAQNMPITGMVAQYGFVDNGKYTGNIPFDSATMCFVLDKDCNWDIKMAADSDIPFSVSLEKEGIIIQQAKGGVLDFSKLKDQKRLWVIDEIQYLQDGGFKNPLYKNDKLCIVAKNCTSYHILIKELAKPISMVDTNVKAKSEVVKIAGQIVGKIPDIYQIKAGIYSLKWKEKERYFTTTTDGTLKLVEGQWYFNDALVVF